MNQFDLFTEPPFDNIRGTLLMKEQVLKYLLDSMTKQKKK
jgi:hypothetical protein